MEDPAVMFLPWQNISVPVAVEARNIIYNMIQKEWKGKQSQITFALSSSKMLWRSYYRLFGIRTNGHPYYWPSTVMYTNIQIFVYIIYLYIDLCVCGAWKNSLHAALTSSQLIRETKF